LVEDDDACAEFVIEAFGEARERVSVTRVVRLQEALQQLATIPVDVVLLDLTLPDAFDILGVNAIRTAAPDLPIVVLTGSLDAALGARVIAAGADDYLQKDQVDADLLKRSILYARDRRACLDDAGGSAAEKQQRQVTGGDKLDGSLDVDAMMAAVAAVALPKFAAWCVIQIYKDDRVIHDARAGVRPAKAAPGEDVTAVMRSGQPSPAGGNTLVIPLLVRGGAKGALQLGRPEDAARYSADDLDLAVELARRAALMFESARLHEMTQATIEHRDVFLSIASHELRKPLSKLQIQIDRMQRSVQMTAPFKRRREQAISRMNRIMTASDGIAAGRLVIEVGEMDLAELAHEVVHRHRRESKVNSSVVIPTHGAGRATGVWDRLLIEHVMTNLLNHAGKYGSSKPIELSVVTEADVVTFSVCDHGIGIAAHDLGGVFDRFELHVSRQIVEAHGGSIDVESELAQGCLVTVRLPRQPAGASPTADATP
jgi:signal transduction histidine kinase/ActR/RegA family two-component response regulator